MSEAVAALRTRLPNRRECLTETIVVGNAVFEAAVGFDERGRPKEIFLSGAKDGSGMAAILADTAIAASIMLQHGIPAAAVALSLTRLPGWPKGAPAQPASVIGAALDLAAAYEAE